MALMKFFRIETVVILLLSSTFAVAQKKSAAENLLQEFCRETQSPAPQCVEEYKANQFNRPLLLLSICAAFHLNDPTCFKKAAGHLADVQRGKQIIADCKRDLEYRRDPLSADDKNQINYQCLSREFLSYSIQLSYAQARPNPQGNLDALPAVTQMTGNSTP